MNTTNPFPLPPQAGGEASPAYAQPAPGYAMAGGIALHMPPQPAPYEDALPPRAKINISFFDFFTWAMHAMVLVVIGVILWGHEMILTTFLHHVELNGIIAGITVYGIFRVYSNSTSLYRTALYVKRIQDMEQNPATTESDIARLVAGLKGAGSMLDIQNTEMALRRMLKSGFFVITDNDSRLIKSKIGARVRYRYNHIAFFAGILISFGLLGTFVGLIATVASVGEQMGMVSSSLASGKEMNIIDLITGISKPMEGMGTAFGASLFGLAGSMLLGGLNHVAGHAQDHFMENLSRWLDDRIPSLKGKTAEKTAEKVGIAAGNLTGQTMSLETGTFMVLAEDTHKQLRAIGGFMEELSATLRQQQAGTQALQALQQQNAQSIQSLQATMAAIPAVGQQLAQVVTQWQTAMGQQQQANTAQLAQLLGQIGQLPGTGEKLGAEVRAWRESYDRNQQLQAEQVQQLGSLVRNLNMSGGGLAPAPAVTAAPKSGGLFGFGKPRA